MVAPCVNAISPPPAAGPATDERWKLPVLQATARGKVWRETNCGNKEELAGQRKVRADPALNRQK